MRALYYNILQDYLALTMDHEDPNYPIENIFSTLGTLRTQTTLDHTVITITFTADQSADTFCLAFSSMVAASTIICVYKNAGGATIFTDNLTMGTDYIKRSYFTKLTTIRSIILTITNAAAVLFYIGKIWIGCKIDLPNFEALPVFGFGNFSGYAKTKKGQVTGQVNGSLKRWELNWPIIDNQTTMNAIKTYFDTINNLPHFIDLFEEIDGNVYWCQYTIDSILPTKQHEYNRKYSDIKLIIEECL
jgi:hypothetical protein